MKREHVRWYHNSRYFLVNYIKDEEVADKILQYEILSVVWSCIKDTEIDIRLLKQIIISLYESLDAKNKLNENWLEEFYTNSQVYKEFLGMYNLPCDLLVKNIGKHWFKLIDLLEDKGLLLEKIAFVKGLNEYCVWLEPYCTIYVYQYLEKTSQTEIFDTHRLSILQYWEYMEIKEYLRKINELGVDEQIMMLTRCLCYSDFDKSYPDWESLVLEIVEKGIAIPEAFKIIKQVKKGRGLSTSMEKNLLNAGFGCSMIDSMKSVIHLKGRRNAVVKWLYVKELV